MKTPLSLLKAELLQQLPETSKRQLRTPENISGRVRGNKEQYHERCKLTSLSYFVGFYSSTRCPTS
jgi:hypothetical protein